VGQVVVQVLADIASSQSQCSLPSIRAYTE
jgi:hypothetical protein